MLPGGKTSKNHYSGGVDLPERVDTSFLDPICSLTSYSGDPKDPNGRPGQVLRQNSQMGPFKGVFGRMSAGRRRRMGSNYVGTQKGAHIE